MHLIEKLDKTNFFGAKNSRKAFLGLEWKLGNNIFKCQMFKNSFFVTFIWVGVITFKKCYYALWKTFVTPLGLNHFLIFGSTYISLSLILSNNTFRLWRLNCWVCLVYGKVLNQQQYSELNMIFLESVKPFTWLH